MSYHFQVLRGEDGSVGIARTGGPCGDTEFSLGMQAIELRDLLLREFPLHQPTADDLIGPTGWPVRKERRERIATAALQAVQMNDPEGRYTSWANWAADAVDLADALIARLDKES